MELVGRILKRTLEKNSNGSYTVLKNPLYTFILENNQSNFCCFGVKDYLKYIQFKPVPNIQEASNINYASLMGLEEEDNFQRIVRLIRFCPVCGVAFTTRVARHTTLVQIRIVETTFQEVEVDDSGPTIEQ